MNLFDHTIAQALVLAVDAYKEHRLSGNTLWQDRWGKYIKSLIKRLPSGDGFDRGTQVHVGKSRPELLVLLTAFQHKKADWTEHTIRVRPGFHGLNITISGSTKNGIKKRIHEAFLNALTRKEDE